MRLVLSLLGQFEGRLDGQPVNGFQSDKARALLAYLAVESNRPLRRELLANLFWPEVTGATARTNLRGVLLNLRQIIGDPESHSPFLIVTRESIQFNLQSEYWLDVAEFNRLITRSGDKPADFEEVDLVQDEVEPFKSALSLYRGSFLEGLSIKDSPGFDDWSYSLRERLQHQASNALNLLASYYERCGQIDGAVQYAGRWVNLTPWQEEAHYCLMRLLALNGERAAALSQYEACSRQLNDHLGVEPASETVRLYEAIRDGHLDKLTRATGELLPAPGESPFKGLQFFDVNDANLFFGREALTARLIKRLQQMLTVSPKDNTPPESRILAVVGASGSGKSSLVRAGLAAVAKRGGLSMGGDHASRGNATWTIDVITPGDRPLAALQALEEKDHHPRLLVVDQFEELFTLCHNESEREAFITQLLYRDDLIVITLRADFYAHCAGYPALRKALSACQEYLGGMSMTELRRAIEEPAQRNGWQFEDGLVDLLMRDVGASSDHAPEPGALPLLSHALFETWKRRNGHMLTHKGYAEAGGVHGVIAKTAEMVFASLDPDQQAITQRIFLRLTELGEGTQDTRRRVSLSELVPGGSDRQAILEVVDCLAAARLVVTEWNPASKQEEVEMAHEALIRHWPRLRGWLEEDRAELRLGERIRDASQEWQTGGRIDNLLVHRNERLQAALQLAQTGRLVFNQVEMDYLMACRNQSEGEVKAVERRRRGLFIIALAVAVVMALVAIWGFIQANSANQQAEISLAQQLAAQAADMLKQPSMNEIAVLLTIESINHNPVRAAEQLLADSLSLFPRTISKMTSTERLTAVVFSPDGKWVASGGWNKTIRVWAADTGQEVNNLVQEGRVTSITFSLDGKYIASGGQDGTARIWDVASGRELTRMTCNGVVWSIAFSPDGKWVVTGSEDGTARVWDTRNGSEVARMTHTGIVYSVAFSPDGHRVLSASQDSTARVWDPANGHEWVHIKSSSELWAAAYSRDGQRIVTAEWDGAVRVWNANSGIEMVHMQHNEDVRSVAFNPDGTRVVSGSDDGTARVWDVSTGRELSRMQHSGRVLSTAFNPNGKLVISGSEDGTARVWEVETGHELTRMQHEGTVSAVTFSPDGKRVASASWDGTAKVWQTQTGRELARMQFDGGVSAVAFSPDGKQVVSSSDDGMARVWNAQNGQELAHMLHGGGVTSVAFSPDGKLVISGSQDSTARIWQAINGQEVTRMVHNQAVWAVAFSPDGKRVLSGDQDGLARVWDVVTKREMAHIKHGGPVLSVGFSPDGQQAVSASQDGSIRVWDAQSGREIAFMQQDGSVQVVTFSPNGQNVLSGGQDGIVRLWNARTGQELSALRHEGAVTSAAYSLDGRWVATGSQDGTLRVWDIKTGLEVARIQNDKAVSSVAFSPDGSKVASGSQDGTARVWVWRNQDLIEMACTRLDHNLTQAEWKQYMGDRPYHLTCANLPAGK